MDKRQITTISVDFTPDLCYHLSDFVNKLSTTRSERIRKLINLDLKKRGFNPKIYNCRISNQPKYDLRKYEKGCNTKRLHQTLRVSESTHKLIIQVTESEGFSMADYLRMIVMNDLNANGYKPLKHIKKQGGRQKGSAKKPLGNIYHPKIQVSV